MAVVDFSSVQSFEALPAGVYDVALVDFEEGEGAKGLYYKLTMEVIGGEYSGRRLWSNLSQSPQSLWKMREALIAFGEDPEDLKGSFEVNMEKYLGQEFQVSVEQSSYQGSLTNSITQFGAPDAPTPKTPSGGTAKRPSTGSKPSIR